MSPREDAAALACELRSFAANERTRMEAKLTAERHALMDDNYSVASAYECEATFARGQALGYELAAVLVDSLAARMPVTP